MYVMNNLLISAIVPVYNTPEKYLKECIDSVLSQTYPHFELIIVDDGSEEKCGAICDNYANSDSRIKVIHQENSGVSVARNTGIEHAKGQFLTFIDSDDSLVPNAWETALNALEKHNADCVVFGWIDYSQNDTFVNQIVSEERVVSSHEYQKVIASDDIKYGGGYPWNKIWRTKSITSNGSIPKYLPKLNIYEDKLWALEASTNINNVVLIPNQLYNYRYVPSSITQDKEQQIPRFALTYDAYNKILDYLQDSNDEAYVLGYNFLFKLIKKHICVLEEEKIKYKEELKISENALKKLCKRIRPRTLYVPVKSQDFFTWFKYHYSPFNK